MVGWFVLAALNCAVIIPWLSTLVHPRDSDAFYVAAQMYRRNPGHMLYDLGLQLHARQQILGISRAAASKYFLPFNHLPYELVLWLPMTALPAHLAFWVWRIENLGLLALASWLFAKTLVSERDVKTVFLISLAFFPVPWCLLMGQDSLVILALFAVCLWCLKREQDIFAGIALGLCLFKFQFVLPIMAIMLFRRSWRVIAGFASSAMMVLAVSTAMVGYDGMSNLLRLWLQGESGTITCIDPLTMPNIRGLIAGIPNFGLRPPAMLIATAAISGLLLLLATREVKTTHVPEYTLAISVCFAVLVSFHTNVYDLAILILPILMLFGIDIPSRQRQWILIPPLFLLFFSPIYVVAIALFRAGPLAILVAWLWYGIGYGMRGRETGSLVVRASAPELAS